MPFLRGSHKLRALGMRAGVSNSLEYLGNDYSSLNESLGEAITHTGLCYMGLRYSHYLILQSSFVMQLGTKLGWETQTSAQEV